MKKKPKQPVIPRPCQVCKVMFKPRDNHPKHKYCSRECMAQAYKTIAEKICPQCNKTFLPKRAGKRNQIYFDRMFNESEWTQQKNTKDCENSKRISSDLHTRTSDGKQTWNDFATSDDNGRALEKVSVTKRSSSSQKLNKRR